ncbi:Uncharacterised protein [Dermatophilus congolensis]|uniref:Uncharacterized protein n=1 Tax=Dermatophilus congolensis TaxID=1863 RepID=A0A239VQK5_9MICO|nr:Uncharacterised protein [Dermatophilus congolensis]
MVGQPPPGWTTFDGPGPPHRGHRIFLVCVSGVWCRGGVRVGGYVFDLTWGLEAYECLPGCGVGNTGLGGAEFLLGGGEGVAGCGAEDAVGGDA